jgi:TonB family protein
MGHRLLTFILVLLITTNVVSAQESQPSEHARPVVRHVAPIYPELARRSQITGLVRLRATIAPNGSVKAIEPVGGNPLLLKAAQDAVTNWKYAPAPTETQELIELRFSPR